jgi:hypothetical protein
MVTTLLLLNYVYFGALGSEKNANFSCGWMITLRWSKGQGLLAALGDDGV